MDRFFKILFFGLIVKPVVFFWLGLNVFFKERLPQRGPAILVANHNSHLDTMVLMSLYPLREIHRIRPVAAADYFLSNRFLAWFSLNVIGIIPIRRGQTNNRSTLFDGCYEALDQGDILVLFPEGSRGKSEQLSELKRGIHLLLRTRPEINVTPIMMHGLGRALPKGETVFVPFNCDVVVGENVPFNDVASDYVNSIAEAFNELLALCMTRQKVVVDDD